MELIRFISTYKSHPFFTIIPPLGFGSLSPSNPFLKASIMRHKTIQKLCAWGKALLLSATVCLSLAASTPVQKWGALQVRGSQICDKNGNPVQLRGMSLFWSQWSGSWWNASVVDNQISDWNANVIRAAMGVDESGSGYLYDPSQKERVKTIVNRAIEKGIYVIIDWHDHNATAHTNQAKAFFREMAQTYGHAPNVIFEVFNEPKAQSWGEVKAYAEQVIGEIRAAGSNNLVVVGNPTWSQDVHLPAGDPITRFGNIAYTLHFYAGTHFGWLRTRAEDAMARGIALFVTEWGTCDASGNGGFNFNESWAWLDWMNRNKISSCNWSLFDKNETASAIKPGGSTTGPWPDWQLTESGKLARDFIRMNGTIDDDDDGTDANLPAVITLKAKVNGKFVCADKGGSAPLIANRAFAAGWETFDVVRNGDGSYSFKARANGKFVCAENYGNSALIANRTAIGDWEKFWVTKHGDGSVSLKAKVNGKYVCADNWGNSPLIADRTSASDWEQFWVN